MKKHHHLTDTIYIFAARYAMQRPTSASFQVIKAIQRDWEVISPKGRKQLLKEVKNEAININEWEKVLELSVDSEYTPLIQTQTI